MLGLVLMFVTASLDYRRIRRWTPVVYVVSVLLLGAVLAVGQVVNGAKAWIALPGGFQVEPSEFAKLGLILAAAYLISRRNLPSGRPTIRDVLYAVLAAAPLIALVEKEPALGVTLVLVFTLAGIIVVSGIRVYWVLGGLAAVAAAVYAVAKLQLLHGYQLDRLTAFLHPEQDLAGSGYNGLQAKIAIGSGGLHGQGLFHGTFTGGSFVPSVQTDFIFTVVGEELGFIGCAAIVARAGLHRLPRHPRRPARRRHVRHAGRLGHRRLVRLPVLRQRRHDHRHHADHRPAAAVRLLRRLGRLRRHDRHRPAAVGPPSSRAVH